MEEGLQLNEGLPIKNVDVQPAAGGRVRRVEISPRTTVRDVREQLGVDDQFILTLGRGAEAFHDDEELFPLVPDKSRLILTTPTIVSR